MKAIGFYSPGDPDVLEVVEMPDPAPAHGEVLLRVKATAVSPIDTVRRAGGREWVTDAPNIPGMDAAGIVEAIGPETATDLQVGDRAMAIVIPQGSYGSYAEKVVVPAESVVKSPHGSSDAEVATLPMNGLTARLALDTLNLKPGQTLAVTGAAGTLGGYVIQLAKHDGLTVVADAAQKDKTLVAFLGADHIVPRGTNFSADVRKIFPQGVDGAVDAAVLEKQVAQSVRDGATIITLRYYDEPAERGITFQPIKVAHYSRERNKLQELSELAQEGSLTLRVAKILPAELAPEAHRLQEAGGIRGRIVLTF